MGKQIQHSFANGETCIFPAPQLKVACIYIRIRGSITFHLNTCEKKKRDNHQPAFAFR